jgi:hypothetical protein
MHKYVHRYESYLVCRKQRTQQLLFYHKKKSETRISVFIRAKASFLVFVMNDMYSNREELKSDFG